jgi:transcriptional regulator with XRE-family HTH domain
MVAMAQPVGDLLREWRQRRRMSQLDLASEAAISTRHLSFLETGRAQPSRDMVLHLAEQLEVPITIDVWGDDVDLSLTALLVEAACRWRARPSIC